MILPTTNFIFILPMVFFVEASPFLNTNFHLPRVRRVLQNFDKSYATQYPSLRFPLRRSPEMFSGSTGSSILRQPTLRLVDTLRRIRERSSLPLRSMTSMNVADNSQYSNDFNQRFGTAEKIERFGQRVRDSVQRYKNGRGKATQQTNELFDHIFNFGEAKDRLRQALLGKKALMDKLHSIGWRGKYVGVPYHTMNDEHTIVKKPGADFGLVSGSNVRVPSLSPVPAIEPIRPEHPVIPELTTSVQDSEQVLGIPAAADSFVFPITLTTGEILERIIDNGDIEIANSIPNDRLTADQVSSNSLDQTDGGGISTTPLIHTTTGSGILELIADRIPFDGIKEHTEEVDALFKTENEAVTDSTIDAGTTTGIVSTLFSTLSTPVTSETDASSSMPSTFQTTTPVDVLSRIRLDHDTDSVTELDIFSTEVPSTYTFISAETNFVTMDEEFTSSTIDADITTEILSNSSSDSALGRALNDETTSSKPSTSITTTIPDEISTIEFIPTMPPPIQTEIINDPDEGSSIMDIPFATTDILSTYSSTEPTEITTSSNEMPAITEPHFASSEIDTGTTSEGTSTVRDFTVSMGTANLDETIATESLPESRSDNDVDTTTENISTYSSTGSSEVNTIATASFINSILDTETTTAFQPTYFSTTPNKITSALDVMFSTYTPLETSTIIETDMTEEVTSIIQDFTDSAETLFSNEISTNPAIPRAITEDLSTNSTIEPTESSLTLDEISTTMNIPFHSSSVDGETTTEFGSTYSFTVPSEIPTNSMEISTPSSTLSASLRSDAETTTEIIPNYWDIAVSTVSADSDEISTIESIPKTGSTNYVDTTTEKISPFPSTQSIELVSNFEEIFTTTTPPFTSSALDTEKTTEFLSTYFSTISKETTSALNEIFTTSTPFANLTTDAETTTEIIPMVQDSIVSTDTPYFKETSTTIDITSAKPAIDIDTTTEYFSTHPPTWPTEQVTMNNEIVTTTNPPSASSTIDALDRITEAVSTYSSTITTEKVMLTDTMSFVDVDATDVASTSSTTYEETTTDIVSTLSTIIPTDSETSIVPIIGEYDDEVKNLDDYETIESNSKNPADRSMFRKLDSVSPRLDYTNEEEPDEKTLLNLIPLIIAELKKGNLTPEEKETLSQGFGDLWPLMVEESKRKSSEPMNENLAVYLFEAGQQLSPING